MSLYNTLHRLVERKSTTLIGFFFLGTRVINVWFKSLGISPEFKSWMITIDIDWPMMCQCLWKKIGGILLGLDAFVECICLRALCTSSAINSWSILLSSTWKLCPQLQLENPLIHPTLRFKNELEVVSYELC